MIITFRNKPGRKTTQFQGGTGFIFHSKMNLQDKPTFEDI